LKQYVIDVKLVIPGGAVLFELGDITDPPNMISKTIDIGI
jgi:hypothetical protein